MNTWHKRMRLRNNSYNCINKLVCCMYTVIPYYRIYIHVVAFIYSYTVQSSKFLLRSFRQSKLTTHQASDRNLFAAASSYMVREFLNLSLVLGLGVWLKLKFRIQKLTCHVQVSSCEQAALNSSFCF